MILINLLPIELRPRVVKQTKIPVLPIAIGLFIIFIGVSLINLYVSVNKSQELRSLKTQWERLKIQNKEAEQLQRELSMGLKQEVNFYDTVVDPPIEVGMIFGFISELIPDSVRLVDLKYEGQRGKIQVVMNGFSEVSQAASKLVEIQKFANNLKEKAEELSASANPVDSKEKKVFKASVTTSSAAEGVRGENQTQFAITVNSEEGSTWQK